MHSLAAASFQSHALVRATQFLHLRHQMGGTAAELDELVELMDGDVTAYGLKGRSEVGSFLAARDFPVVVVSIRANASRSAVTVEYEDSYLLVREEILFGAAPEYKITSVQSTYTAGDTFSLPRRGGRGVGGVGSSDPRALVFLRLLRLAAAFLFTDVHRDLLGHASYLTDATPAFGAVGREAIMEIERQGTAAGTRYSLPFPLLVNAEAHCVVLDFLAHNMHKPDTPAQRGTDFLYLDIDAQKVLRVDTLRHTLEQPDWVLQHFTGKASSYAIEPS
jgi:hypothetical protein